MTTKSITLNLPEILYEKLKQQAIRKERSVETELLEVVNAAIPQSEEKLSADLANALTALAYLDDKRFGKRQKVIFRQKR
jgi:plasmid stability protein